MSNKRNQILSFLLNNDIEPKERLQVAREIDSRFPSTGEFEILPKIIEDLQEKEKAPSLDHLREHYSYDRLSKLNGHSENSADIMDLVEDEYQDHVRQSVINEATELVEGDTDDVYDFLDRIRDLAYNYDKKISNKEKKDVYDVYKMRKNQRENIKTYCPPIDDKIGNLSVGTLSTIAAKTGQLKTTLAINQMYNGVVQDNNNFVFLTFEMDRSLIYYHLMAKHAQSDKFIGDEHSPIDKERIEKHDLTEDEEEWVFNEVKEDLEENYGDFEVLELDDFRSLSAEGYRSYFNSLGFTPDCVIADYIQYLKHQQHEFDVYATNPINWYVKQFVDLSKDVDGADNPCHVTLLSQVNRNGYQEAKENDGKYTLNAISEANAVERNCQYIWFSYAPEELLQMNQAKVQLKKNRSSEKHENPQMIDINPSVGEIIEDEFNNDVDADTVDEIIEEQQSEIIPD